jgi:hypothetical protein
LSDTATISTADGEIDVSLQAKHGPNFQYLKKIRNELVHRPACLTFARGGTTLLTRVPAPREAAYQIE